MMLSAPPVRAVSSDPMGSLSELRSRHSAMLQRARSAADGGPSPGEILGFLESASRTGAMLDDPDDRDRAQGILDHWTAALLSQAPQAAESARAFSLEDYSPQNAAALQSEAQCLADDAAAILDKARALDATALPGLRRALLLLVNLKEGSLDAFPTTVPDTHLVLGDAAVRAALDRMEKEGIVRRVEDATAPGAQFRLSHDVLLVEWPFLRKLLTQRRAFRELARGWEKGGKQKAALLNRGEQLELARHFQDRSRGETEFLEESREFTGKMQRLLLGAALIAVGFLVTMIFSLSAKTEQLDRALKEAKELEKQARNAEGLANSRHAELLKANEAEKAATAKEVEALKKAEVERNLAKAAQSETKVTEDGRQDALRKIQEQLEQGNEAAKQARQQIQELRGKLSHVADELADRTGLPDSVKDIVAEFRSQSASFAPDDTHRIDTTQATLIQALNPSLYGSKEPPALVQPGLRISLKPDDAGLGSLGVILSGEDGARYLAAPAYVLQGGKDAPVFVAGTSSPVGKIWRAGDADSKDLQSISLARLETTAASNTLLGSGLITAVHTNPVAGTPVEIVGSGSGRIPARIKLPSDRAGNVVLEPIPPETALRLAPGDSGAPVVTADKQELVGLLVGGDGKQVRVRPIQSLLERYKLRIYNPGAAENKFAGALAEVFVSAKAPEFIEKAAPLVEALRKAGIVLPVPAAQPKMRVASGKTEVRCFYKEDEALAGEVLKLLLANGFTDANAKTVLIPDSTASRKFIQISVASSAPIFPTPAPAPNSTHRPRSRHAR